MKDSEESLHNKVNKQDADSNESTINADADLQSPNKNSM